MTSILILFAACGNSVDPAECTTGEAWTGGDEESPLMHPGSDCVGCHTEEGEGPRYDIAGTVMPTTDEFDDCYGVEGALVRITDADGVVHELETNAAGNFFTNDDIALPYQAEVEFDGAVRTMVAAQTEGSCGVCHTETGAEGAPGRILVPE